MSETKDMTGGNVHVMEASPESNFAFPDHGSTGDWISTVAHIVVFHKVDLG